MGIVGPWELKPWPTRCEAEARDHDWPMRLRVWFQRGWWLIRWRRNWPGCNLLYDIICDDRLAECAHGHWPREAFKFRLHRIIIKVRLRHRQQPEFSTINAFQLVVQNRYIFEVVAEYNMVQFRQVWIADRADQAKLLSKTDTLTWMWKGRTCGPTIKDDSRRGRVLLCTLLISKTGHNAEKADHHRAGAPPPIALRECKNQLAPSPFQIRIE